MSDNQDRYVENAQAGNRRRRRPPSIFWPLVLIGAGILLLLSNLGYVPWQSWSMLWRLWPVLLIALGIDVLIGRRSWIGAIVSALLILILIGGAVALALFAPHIPPLANLAQPMEWRIEHVEHPLDGVERASVSIDWTSTPGALRALRDPTNLIEADVALRGELIFDVAVRGDRASVELDRRFSGPWFGPFDLGGRAEDRWDVRLSPDALLELSLDAGSGSYEFDLTGLQISQLVLDAGSGPIELTLPAGSNVEAEIDGGSGPLAIAVPAGVGVRVMLDSGSGAFDPGEKLELVEGARNGDGVWETEDFHTAGHTIVLAIDQGSGPVRVG